MGDHTRKLLKAITNWSIDAAEGENPAPHFMTQDRIDQFFEKRPSYVVGKKGTGKTAFARRLSNEPALPVAHVQFDQVLTVQRDILAHQKSPTDSNVARAAMQLAAIQVGIQAIADRVPGRVTKIVDRIVSRTRRDKILPKAANAVSRIGFRANGNNQEDSLEVTSKQAFEVRNGLAALESALDSVENVARSAAPIFILIDGIDDHDGFRKSPFSETEADLLRAAILSSLMWRSRKKRAIDLILLVRPEFIEIAELPNRIEKIADVSWPLRWDNKSLIEMLSYRINEELDRIVSTAERATYSGRRGTRAVFGETEEEHQDCLHRLTSYSFLRPRDVIKYAKAACQRELDYGDPGVELTVAQLDSVLDDQRKYLSNEISAELAITLTHHDKFIERLTNMQATMNTFIDRIEFDNQLADTIASTNCDLEARAVAQRLYTAYAIGYRSLGNSRQFGFQANGKDLLPDHNNITLHDLFLETPRSRLAS